MARMREDRMRRMIMQSGERCAVETEVMDEGPEEARMVRARASIGGPVGWAV